MYSIATQLNGMLWENGYFVSRPGDPALKVIGVGRRDDYLAVFRGAELEIEGKYYRGTVYLTDPDMQTIYADDAVLEIASARGCSKVRLGSGQAVYNVEAQSDPELTEMYNTIVGMRSSKTPTLCSDHIASMDEVKRVQIFTRLFNDRSFRKYVEEVSPLLDSSNGDWNYAMYVTLFKAAGGSKYKQPYMRLASRVPYKAVAHEKGSPVMVEALLLGASGLLHKQKEDDYVVELKRQFDYLCRKYDITPMQAGEWDAHRSTSDLPYGMPVLRIVQLAAFLSTREFVFDAVVKCRKPQDVYSLFRAEPSRYWVRRSGCLGMGVDFMDRMGINFVVPLMFAYGAAMNNDGLVESAQDLMDLIHVEDNRIVNLWNGRGVRMLNACDSQAILELNNEYCLRQNCPVCPVGRQVIKNQIELVIANK